MGRPRRARGRRHPRRRNRQRLHRRDAGARTSPNAPLRRRHLGAGARADALADLAEVFPEPFDAIVSNPPYVPECERAAMHPNVRDYEPREALFVPDDDPLRFYRAIARAGRRMLRPGGRLYFEIHPPFAEAMRCMLGEEGYAGTEVRDDLFGKPRMTCSRLQ